MIIEGIAANPTSLGWVGFAFVEENLDTIKPLAGRRRRRLRRADRRDDRRRQYPIARDLYIYVNAAKAEENPALAAFVDYYLSDEGIAILGRDVDDGQVPYVPSRRRRRQRRRRVWDAQETGTRDGGA